MKKERPDSDENEEKRNDDLSDEELDEIFGGIDQAGIRVCSECGAGVAVFDLDICAACFRKRHRLE